MNLTCLDLVTAAVRGVSTDETLAMTRFVIQWVYMPIVVILGVAANLVNMVVLTRKEMFSSTNYYLAVLACCDILFLLGGMLATMPKLIPALILWHPFMFLTSYFQVMTTYVSNLSVAIICCFTVERFVVIRWPMKGRVWCTRDKAKRIVLAAAIFTLLIELPNLIFYAPQLQVPRGKSKAVVSNTTTDFWLCVANNASTLYNNLSLTDTAYLCVANQSRSVANGNTCRYWRKTPTWLASEYEALIFVMSWVTAMLFAFLPLVLLFVLNGYLIRSVLIARSERCQMTNTRNNYKTASIIEPGQQYWLLTSSKTAMTPQQVKAKREHSNERKVTIMLIAVVLLFLACHLPNAFGLLYTTALERKYSERIPTGINNQRLIMNNIFNALTQLNAAANFILYSLLSKKFSMTMRRLLAASMGFLCRWRELRQTEVSGSITSLNMVTVGSERTSYHVKSSALRTSSVEPHDVSPCRPPHNAAISTAPRIGHDHDHDHGQAECHGIASDSSGVSRE